MSSRRDHQVDVQGRILEVRLPGLLALDFLGASILFSFCCLASLPVYGGLIVVAISCGLSGIKRRSFFGSSQNNMECFTWVFRMTFLVEDDEIGTFFTDRRGI